MKHLFRFFLIGCISLFISCGEEPQHPFIDQNYNLEVFSIPTGLDTTLITSTGVKITIQKESLISDEGTVKLQVKTAISRYDMVKMGLSTLTDKDELLESEGMINIITDQQTTINKLSPIEIAVPTHNLDRGMSVFRGIENRGSLRWQESEIPIKKNEDLFDVERGEKLYKENCAACHRIDRTLIGPALGGITDYRDSAFIYDFTRDSYKMVQEGHVLANCLFIGYNKLVMPPYPDLTNDEIRQIYLFIDQERESTGCIVYSKNTFMTDCVQDGDNFYALNRQGDTIRTYSNRTDTITRSIYSGIFIQGKIVYYEFNISDFGWYNVDDFLGATEIERFQIHFSGTQSNDVYAFMMSEERKVLLPLENIDGNYTLFNNYFKDKIRFPIDEKFIIIAVEVLDDGTLNFGRKTIISKAENNQYRIEMKFMEEEEFKAILNR